MHTSDDTQSRHPGDKVTAVIAMVIFLNFFLLQTVGNFGVTLVLSAFALFMLFVSYRNRIRSPRYLAGLACIAAAGISIRANPAITFMLCMASGFFSLLTSYVHSFPDGFFRHSSEVLLVPFRFIGSAFEGMFAGWSFLLAKRQSSGGIWKSVFVGLLFGLPAALVLTGLLSQADPIFGKFTDTVLSGPFVQRLITRVFVSSVAFVGLLPLAFMVFRVTTGDSFEKLRALPAAREIFTAIVCISIVLGAFLVVQWPYIFARVAAETDLSKFGVATYSEYVKRGFGELLVVSVLLYVLSWAGILALRGMPKKSWMAVAIQAVLFGEAGIFILSIFRRIALYVQFHGLTLGRVYGGVVLIAVTWLFFTLAGRLWKRQYRWILIEGIGLVCLMVAVFVTNTEHIIATRYPPTVNHAVDYVYLSRLSADGFAGWKKAYESILPVYDTVSKNPDSLLMKPQRTQIYYSGVILSGILGKYHRLMQIYGTPDEIRSYVRNVFVFQLRLMDDYIPEIERRASDEAASGMTAGAFQTFYRKTLEDRAWITKTVEKGIPDPRGSLHRVSIQMLAYGSFGRSDAMLPSLYRIDTKENPDSREYDAADRLYQLNLSERTAFRRMTAEIPISMLLVLQREFTLLRHRIWLQPPGEQDWAQDSSFDGPFLSPVFE